MMAVVTLPVVMPVAIATARPSIVTGSAVVTVMSVIARAVDAVPMTVVPGVVRAVTVNPPAMIRVADHCHPVTGMRTVFADVTVRTDVVAAVMIPFRMGCAAEQ